MEIMPQITEQFEKINTQNTKEHENATERNLDEFDSDKYLKEIIKNEMATRIRTNSRYLKESDRELIDEQTPGKEIEIKKSFLGFDYIKNYLLFGEILDTVIENGILGTVKKKWQVILDKLKGKLDQLAPETREVITSSIREMFEEKKIIDEYLEKTSPDELFSEIIGDGKQYKLKGKIYAKTFGSILAIYLPNGDDLGKVYFKKGKLSKDEKLEIVNLGGYATIRFLKSINQDVDMVCFSNEPTMIYRSTLLHEIYHGIFHRFFDPSMEPTDEEKYRRFFKFK